MQESESCLSFLLSINFYMYITELGWEVGNFVV